MDIEEIYYHWSTAPYSLQYLLSATVAGTSLSLPYILFDLEPTRFSWIRTFTDIPFIKELSSRAGFKLCVLNTMFWEPDIPSLFFHINHGMHDHYAGTAQSSRASWRRSTSSKLWCWSLYFVVSRWVQISLYFPYGVYAMCSSWLRRLFNRVC